jgi:hypothetical protein
LRLAGGGPKRSIKATNRYFEDSDEEEPFLPNCEELETSEVVAQPVMRLDVDFMNA